jgi:hypothetical protein
MKMIEIKPGDIFCVRGASPLSGAIRLFSKLISSDNNAYYNHSGIFLSSSETFEALNTYKRQDFYSAYQGKEVIIGRHLSMTPELFEKGSEEILKFEGLHYPVLRLIVHTNPILVKYLYFKRPVCSELVWLFLKVAGMDFCNYAWGKNPDHVADAIERWRVFEVIAKGRLDKCKFLTT